MSCIWQGTDRPRAIAQRHVETCAGDGCKGCQPCEEAHCRLCAKTHTEHVCPGCLYDTRETLTAIRDMAGDLRAEAVVKGVESEAMNLLGPIADPEARGHLEASVAAGRVPQDWLEVADDERHPLMVLASWQDVYAEAFELEVDETASVERAGYWLDLFLTRISEETFVPVEEFARDLRACRAHMERVLHDGEQRDTGAPCLRCGVRLVREWGKFAAADGWRCPKCKEFSNSAQYALAVKGEYLAQAEWMTAEDCAEWLIDEADAVADVKAVSAGTIRAWASKGLVKKRRDSGRTVYRREDILKAATLDTA